MDENSQTKGNLPQNLPPEQAELLRVLEPYVQEYLTEIKSPATVIGYLKELAIVPIRIDENLIGFWGMVVRNVGPRRLATIKAFYIRKQYRKRFRDRAADDLYHFFVKEGVTELEIWAHPEVQRWLEQRYGITSNIHVSHNPLGVFKPSDSA